MDAQLADDGNTGTSGYAQTADGLGCRSEDSAASAKESQQAPERHQEGGGGQSATQPSGHGPRHAEEGRKGQHQRCDVCREKPWK